MGATSSSSRQEETKKTPTTSDSPTWILRHGLLFSSWNAGVVPNSAARQALVRGVLRAWLQQEQRYAEQQVAWSAMFSPCNGPNTEAWQRMEELDRAMEQLLDDTQLHFHHPMEILRNIVIHNTKMQKLVEIRCVYIPTAMYALRPESTNTPGKQRQRARADARQRRHDIVQLLRQELSSSSSYQNNNINENKDNNENENDVTFSIRTVTLDLDDGSVQHPEECTFTASGGMNTASPPGVATNYTDFPTTGRQALGEHWQPHLVYVQGGNTFWLHHCLVDQGHNSWSERLVHLLQGGGDNTATTATTTPFYCGASAGAIVVGASIETACWKQWDDPRVVPDRPTYSDWHGVAGLGCCGNFSFFPHHQHSSTTQEPSEETLPTQAKELQERTGSKVICLRDDQVVVVDGASQRITIL